MISRTTAGPPIPGFAAVVLAGGRSRRMGRDKTRVTVGGVPLIECVLAVIRPLFSEVVIAGGTAGRFADIAGVSEASDPLPGAGPLAGIRAGLAACAASWAFIVAADMPELDPTLIRRLAGLAAADTRMVLPRRGGLAEPLHAVYHRETVGVIDEMLAAGERRPRRLAELVEVCYVDLDEDEARSLRNLNRPGELAGGGW